MTRSCFHCIPLSIGLERRWGPNCFCLAASFLDQMSNERYGLTTEQAFHEIVYRFAKNRSWLGTSGIDAHSGEELQRAIDVDVIGSGRFRASLLDLWGRREWY